MEPVVLPDDEVRMNEEDVKSLKAAKEKNKETTSTAKRALRVARETQDLAEHTLTGKKYVEYVTDALGFFSRDTYLPPHTHKHTHILCLECS